MTPGRRQPRGAPVAGPTVIVGLGETGVACARHLAGRGVRIAVTDTRRAPPGLATLRRELPEVPLELGALDDRLLAQASRIVVSPGMPLHAPALRRAARRGIRVIGDIELFAEAVSAPVVAITGSNGKSTVTALLGEMLRAAGREVRVGGNLGPPALALLAVDPVPELYVLELSSFQLESTHSLRPRAAALLNVTPDHMDRYRTMAAYAAAKRRVFRGAQVMVLNRDDPWAQATESAGRPVIGFTAGAPGGADLGLREGPGGVWLARGRRRLLAQRELLLPGLHNALNALAALALGSALELPLDAMCAALRRFEGLPHRCQLVAEVAGVRWYNDSKGTNVAAAVAAIRGIGRERRLVLIAGGEGKGADFSPLDDALQGCARGVVLIGRAAAEIAACLGAALPVVRAPDMPEAVAAARRMARAGDAVLLSPACASHDMFSGYEARGQAFIEALRSAGDGG